MFARSLQPLQQPLKQLAPARRALSNFKSLGQVRHALTHSLTHTLL
jgi:hypothetical protein